eukprot:jgi/Ulvmu1/8908/UM049_0090.1
MVALLAAVHFALQLTAQVLLPAALCCSLSGVQACSLMLPGSRPRSDATYDPLATLHPSSGLRLFMAAVAIPHTVAGPAAALLVAAACALWPTPLNLIAAAVLISRLIAWAFESPEQAGDHAPFKPLLAPRRATALAAWVAVQMCAVYALQVPGARRFAALPAVAWARIGVITLAPSLATAVAIAAHATALAALYLALTAVRCGGATDTRAWPTPAELADSVAAAAAAPADGRDAAAASPSGGGGGLGGFIGDTPPGAAPSLLRWSSTLPERSHSSHDKPSFLRGMAMTMTPRRATGSADSHIDRDHSGGLHRWPMGVIESIGDEESLPLLTAMPPTDSEALSDAAAVTAAGAGAAALPPHPPGVAVCAGVCMHALVTVMRARIPTASALVAFAFAFPAGLSAALLLVALPQLLASSRSTAAPPLLRARALLLLTAAWAFVAYTVGAATETPALPAPVSSLICAIAVQYPSHRFLPAITTAAFAAVLLCLAAHCRAHRAGPLWPRVRPNTLAPAPNPRRTATLLSVELLAYAAGCAAVPLLWVAIVSVRVSLAKTLYAAMLALAVVAQQAVPPDAGSAAVLPVLRMLPVCVCAAAHACLLYAVALTPAENRSEWLRVLSEALSGNGALDDNVQAAALLLALVATVGHTVLRQRLQASLGVPHSHGAHSAHDTSSARADVAIPLLGSQRAARRSRTTSRPLERMAEAGVWRRWTALITTLAKANMSAGLNIAALIGSAAALALMPISVAGGALLLLWLLVLLLRPSRPVVLPAAAAAAANDPDWRPARVRFTAHRAATAALSALLLTHIVGQYLLWVAGAAWLSRSTCDTLEAVAGITCGGRGGGAASADVVFLSLCASGAMLACLALYRWLWDVGKPCVDGEATLGVTSALQAQLGFLAFLRRFCIRHCHKALLFSIAAVALWTPSVLGGALLLAAAYAVATNSGLPRRRVAAAAEAGGPLRPTLCSGACTAGAWLCAVWALLQYAVCNAALQAAVGADQPHTATVLRVLGIPMLEDNESERAVLFISVFQKVLIIASCALVQRCEQWRNLLPPQLLRIAPPGTLCALFWPPPGCELHVPRDATLSHGGSPDADYVKARTWWCALSVDHVAKTSRAVLRQVTRQVTRTFAHIPGSPIADPRRSIDDSGSAQFKIPQESAPKEHKSRFPGRRFALLLCRAALQLFKRLAAAAQAILDSVAWLVEDAACVCAADALVFALVLLALLSFEALSLFYISGAAIGMFHRHARAHFLPTAALPTLLAIALLQYACLVYNSRNASRGAPRLDRTRDDATGDDATATVWHWLGVDPTATQLAVLLASAGIAAAARSVAAWRDVADSPSRRSPRTTPGSTTDSASDADQSEPSHDLRSTQHAVHAQHELYYALSKATTSSSARIVPLLATCAAPQVVVVADWGTARPPALGSRGAWGWAEWFRFWLFRLSLDVLMVVVVALCAVQRDLIHAAYLALTLWLFRHREALRLQGNRLFFWLPLANLCVIVLMLLFQAPWLQLTHWLVAPPEREVPWLAALLRAAECVGDRDGGDGGGMRGWSFGGDCSWASLLGLHRIMHAGQWRALELSPHGLGTPLLMWLAIQVQSRLLDEQGFRDTVAQLQAGQAQLRTHVRARAAELLQSSMLRCLALWQSRTRRRARLNRLKRTLNHSRGFAGADPRTLLEDAFASPSHARPSSGGTATTTTTGTAQRGASTGLPEGGSSRVRADAAAEPRPSASTSGSNEPAGHAEDADQAMRVDSDSLEFDGTLPGSRLSSLLASTVATLSHLAMHVHLLCAAVFLLDLSLATAPFPLGSLLYALVRDPRPLYWRALLVYTETLLLLEYVFQVSLQVGCLALDPSSRDLVRQLGLHESLWRSAPLFALYLVLLMHNYFIDLVSRRPGPTTALAAAPAPAATARRHFGVLRALSGAIAWVDAQAMQLVAYLDTVCNEATFPPHCLLIHAKEEDEMAPIATDNAWQNRLAARISAALDALACADMAVAALEAAQGHPDAAIWGAIDAGHPSIRPALALSEAEVRGVAMTRHLVAGGSFSGAAAAAPWVSCFQVSRQLRPGYISVLLQVHAHSASIDHAWQALAFPWWQRWLFRQDAALSRRPPRKPALATQRNLQRVLMLCNAEEDSPRSTASEGGSDGSRKAAGGATDESGHWGAGLLTGGRRRKSWVEDTPERFYDAASEGPGSAAGSTAQQAAGSTMSATPSLQQFSAASLTGPMSTSLQAAALSLAGPCIDGATAAETAAVFDVAAAEAEAAQPSGGAGSESESAVPPTATARTARSLLSSHSLPSPNRSGWPGAAPAAEADSADQMPWLGMKITIDEDMVWHSSGGKDWYTLHLALNALAFVYGAARCHGLVAAHGAAPIDTLAQSHTISAAYLVALIVVFSGIALDRFIYSVGSTRARAALLLAEVLLYFSATAVLMWRSVLDDDNLFHLKVFMGLKVAAMSVAAVQVKAGYPSVQESMAAGRGQGRHSFYFYRHVDTPHWAMFQVFRGIPFLYELKALLDWSVTPTTLTLVDWLKLEDIRASLYNRQCDLMMRASTRAAIGTPQPFASKFALGTLLSLIVIALLWTPLLAFSSSNPTFRIPTISSFAFNASLVYGDGGPAGVTQVPLFNSEHHSTVLPWLRGARLPDGEGWPNATGGPGPLPPSMAAYDQPQLQIMCGSENADSLWPLSPPLRAQLAAALDAAAATPEAAPPVWMEVGFSALRSLPPATAYGGPMCKGAARVRLAAHSVAELRDVLAGEREWATLTASAAGGMRSRVLGGSGTVLQEPGGAREARGFIGWVWQLKEHKCQALPANRGQLLGPEDAVNDDTGLAGWPGFQVECRLGLLSTTAGPRAEWWRMQCRSLDGSGRPIQPDARHSSATIARAVHLRCPPATPTSATPTPGSAPTAPAPPPAPEPASHSAPHSAWGPPMLVAVVEQVQSGLLGETLSSVGITGLYFTLVFGLGRFLRLSNNNMRMRIPYQDLPDVEHLWTLCSDIAVAREEREFMLEEQLFYSLINIYRSPAVLFELTKKDR